MKVQVEEMLDPRLRKYLELLRPVPPRNRVAAARAKANFLAELEGLFEPDQPPQAGFLSNPARWLDALKTRFKRPLVSFNSIPRTALSFTSILLVVIILLFGWVGITARAAETAVPGDTLYSFKTSIEQVQVALAVDLDKQVGLHLEFASHRLQEIERLIDTGRYEKAAALSEKFRFNIQKALDKTYDLSKVDPALAEQRRIEINAQLIGFNAQLDELLGKLPPAYQPAFHNVFPTSQPGGLTPLAPLVTQMPGLSGEKNTPQNEHTGEQDTLDTGTDADFKKESEKAPQEEKNLENSSEEDAGSGLQEDSKGNNDGHSLPSYKEEHGSENTVPEQNQPGDEHGTQDEYSSSGQ
jgi:hypothetical protein